MEKFNEAASLLSGPVREILSGLEETIKCQTFEIRLRSNRPIMLVGLYGSGFVKKDSYFCKHYSSDCKICSPEELKESFNRVCGYSIHTHQNSINEGFVTMKGGHRAGVVGTAVCDSNGNTVSIKDVSSMNIRISREIRGCAETIANTLFKDGAKSLIIAGPPSSGKTTVLRDLIRILAGGSDAYSYKVSVIDEREELASMVGSILGNDLGINSDILNSYPKREAVLLAVRTMSPDIIALDEVGSSEEISAIEQAVNSGVKFILTVHASNFDEIVTRPQIEQLINTYSFDKVCLLSSEKVCTVKAIYDSKEIRDEIYRRRCNAGSCELL
ncbi:MAG: ATPase, T2SS/T4P/T4SS family [Acutalibacteraceae bacterium]